MSGYVVVKVPAEGELCPVLRVGTANDITNVPVGDGEMVVPADLRAYSTYYRPGTWQRMKPFRWFNNGEWHYDDESLHTHVYYVTKVNGEFQFVITEPPLISQTYERATVSAALTIS